MFKTPRAIKIVLLVLTTLMFVIALAVNYISTAALQFGRQIGIFHDYNTTLTWSQRGTFNSISITPAGWTFSVWGAIYIYQGLILIYFWTLVFRRAYEDGPFLCTEPNFLPTGFLVGHFFSSIFNGGWIILAEYSDFNYDLLVPLAIFLIGITACLYFSLICAYRTLWCERSKIVSSGKCMDHGIWTGLVFNGTSLYAGWVTIASFLNIDITLVYFGKQDETTCSICCLSGLIVIVLVYAIADLTVLDFLTRYVFTPHIVVIWACSGVLARNFVAWSATTIMTICLLSVVAVILLVKIVLACLRSKSKPLLSSGEFQLEKKM